jgi:hypothetical protein
MYSTLYVKNYYMSCIAMQTYKELMYSTIMYNCIIVSINLIQEQALPLHELTMLNSTVSSIQH